MHYRNQKPIFKSNPVSQKKKKETFIYIYGFQKKKIFFNWLNPILYYIQQYYCFLSPFCSTSACCNAIIYCSADCNIQLSLTLLRYWTSINSIFNNSTLTDYKKKLRYIMWTNAEFKQPIKKFIPFQHHYAD